MVVPHIWPSMVDDLVDPPPTLFLSRPLSLFPCQCRGRSYESSLTYVRCPINEGTERGDHLMPDRYPLIRQNYSQRCGPATALSTEFTRTWDSIFVQV